MGLKIGAIAAATVGVLGLTAGGIIAAAQNARPSSPAFGADVDVDKDAEDLSEAEITLISDPITMEKPPPVERDRSWDGMGTWEYEKRAMEHTNRPDGGLATIWERKDDRAGDL